MWISGDYLELIEEENISVVSEFVSGFYVHMLVLFKLGRYQRNCSNHRIYLLRSMSLILLLASII